MCFCAKFSTGVQGDTEWLTCALWTEHLSTFPSSFETETELELASLWKGVKLSHCVSALTSSNAGSGVSASSVHGLELWHNRLNRFLARRYKRSEDLRLDSGVISTVQVWSVPMVASLAPWFCLRTQFSSCTLFIHAKTYMSHFSGFSIPPDLPWLAVSASWTTLGLLSGLSSSQPVFFPVALWLTNLESKPPERIQTNQKKKNNNNIYIHIYVYFVISYPNFPQMIRKPCLSDFTSMPSNENHGNDTSCWSLLKFVHGAIALFDWLWKVI